MEFRVFLVFLPLDARYFLSRVLFKFMLFQTHNNERPHMKRKVRNILLKREGRNLNIVTDDNRTKAKSA